MQLAQKAKRLYVDAPYLLQLLLPQVSSHHSLPDSPFIKLQIIKLQNLLAR